MKSIIQTNEYCFFCGSAYTEEHHIRLGNCTRATATKYGLTVRLCHLCHMQTHQEVKKGYISKKTLLQAFAQKKLEETMSHEEYMRIFKKNYL